MSEVKDKLMEFLRHVGNDAVPDGVTAWPECGVDEELDEEGHSHCPDHKDCGLCRFKYMKKHGWLSQQLSLEI